MSDIFRNLTPTGDWLIGKGTAGFAQNNQAIGLDIQTAVLSFKGDCFFAQFDGVDWFNRLNVGQQDALTQEIWNLILQRNGVLAVNTVNVDLNRKTRAISISYDIETVYGNLTGLINSIAGTLNA